MLLAAVRTHTKRQRFDQVEIGRRIREARSLKGYKSAASLGAALVPVIEESTMLKKEQGKAPYSFKELSDICDLLGAPPLFPFVDWDVAEFLERLLPPRLRDTLSGKDPAGK